MSSSAMLTFADRKGIDSGNQQVAGTASRQVGRHLNDSPSRMVPCVEIRWTKRVEVTNGEIIHAKVMQALRESGGVTVLCEARSDQPSRNRAGQPSIMTW